MIPILFADTWQYVLGIPLFLAAVCLILLVLVQRGRGGGLAGAFGGMGGQSAFGTKAGDVFTRITVVAASVWILLCIVSVLVLSNQGGKFGPTSTQTPPASSLGEIPDDTEGGEGSGAGGLGPGSGAGGSDNNTGGTGSGGGTGAE